jgi:hypothetical protein
MSAATGGGGTPGEEAMRWPGVGGRCRSSNPAGGALWCLRTSRTPEPTLCGFGRLSSWALWVSGLVVAVEHAVDVIVPATGFDSVSGGLTQLNLRGTDGTLLRDKRADGIDAHFGMMTAGVPNMIFLYGPQSPSGFCNGPTRAELGRDAHRDDRARHGVR